MLTEVVLQYNFRKVFTKNPVLYIHCKGFVSFCSQSQQYISLVLQVNSPVNSGSEENNMSPDSLGRLKTDMTPICLLTFEVFSH